MAENAPIVRVSEMGSALQEDLPAPEIPPRLEVAFSESAHSEAEDVSDVSEASNFAHFADHAGSDNEEVDRARLTRSVRDAFASLDHVDLQVEFRSRCCIMRSPRG